MKKLAIWLIAAITFISCQPQGENTSVARLSKTDIETTVAKLNDTFGTAYSEQIERGVNHAASLWRANDGSAEEFTRFCLDNFIADDQERELVFNKISRNMEVLLGHFNKISLDLQEPIHLTGGTVHEIDGMFAGYGASAHLTDDLYANKIAFIVALNFPYYSLQEKTNLGENWTRLEWAYARLGDMFESRIPAELQQHYTKVNTDADMYISDYNIYMGQLVNENMKSMFPENMVLLSHWNLRDEIKANYGIENGLDKQQMVYQVMKRIITQEIPEKVINNDQYQWNPYTNKTYKNGEEVSLEREPDTRYQQIINSFHALQAMDEYSPVMDTYIKRNFEGDMEIAQAEVEALFDEFLSSPQVKMVGDLIKDRLGRDLEPFDIWYDGFKARSAIPEEKLNAITEKRFPTAKAMEKELPQILKSLGFSNDRAQFISSKVSVDPARGSGHAWGASMKSEKAHLRTRVPETGMNYKGYNIAIHEFGHNVEQTISLHDVDYYIMNGVPNTSFTEALAFIFQKRDLEILGIKDPNPNKEYLQTLDNFWSIYEIMGVSMVDMKMWKWLYANPDATATQLKETVLQITKEVWNTYYAPVFGKNDELILGIYSHMISYPLYLSAYSYGHLIDFQIEQHLAGKDFANEVTRMFSQGRLVPQLWMKHAVGKEISNEPILKAAEEAVNQLL